MWSFFVYLSLNQVSDTLETRFGSRMHRCKVNEFQPGALDCTTHIMGTIDWTVERTIWKCYLMYLVSKRAHSYSDWPIHYGDMLISILIAEKWRILIGITNRWLWSLAVGEWKLGNITRSATEVVRSNSGRWKLRFCKFSVGTGCEPKPGHHCQATSRNPPVQIM